MTGKSGQMPWKCDGPGYAAAEVRARMGRYGLRAKRSGHSSAWMLWPLDGVPVGCGPTGQGIRLVEDQTVAAQTCSDVLGLEEFDGVVFNNTTVNLDELVVGGVSQNSAQQHVVELVTGLVGTEVT